MNVSGALCKDIHGLFYFHFRLSDLPQFETDSKVQFVIDGVYAFAHALDALKRDVCPQWKGVCPAMTYYDGGDFYKNYLLKVDFIGKDYLKVKF